VKRPGAAARTVAASWRLDGDDVHGGVFRFTVEPGGPPLPDLVRAVREQGLRVAGVAAENAAAGTTGTVHVRFASGARMKRAAARLRAWPHVRDLTYDVF
jgi:hypothetical protein